MRWISMNLANCPFWKWKLRNLFLQSLPSCLVVDAKKSSGLQLEEKRTAIELLAIKQRLLQASIFLRWVNSGQQLSDALTKSWQHEGLIRALQEGKWRIIFDPAYQSARKIRALKRSNHEEALYALYCLWDLVCEVPKTENLSHECLAREIFDGCEF